MCLHLHVRGIVHDPGAFSAMLSDQSVLPALYDDPENFVLERYLFPENGRLIGDLRPTSSIFGLGRKCVRTFFFKKNIIARRDFAWLSIQSKVLWYAVFPLFFSFLRDS
jgi:hypothetical protein